MGEVVQKSSPLSLNLKMYISNRSTLVLGDYSTYPFQILTAASQKYYPANYLRLFVAVVNFIIFYKNLKNLIENLILFLFYFKWRKFLESTPSVETLLRKISPLVPPLYIKILYKIFLHTQKYV